MPNAKFAEGDYTVRPTDTLYSIAWRYDLDVEQLAQWNQLAKPYTIKTGQRLYLRPTKPKKMQASADTSKDTKPPAVKTTSRVPTQKNTTSSAKQSGSVKWQWPVQGEVFGRFKSGSLQHQGIDIGGTIRQPIHAAATGKVVYSGNALQGFGNLIIIKHNDQFLSAYAQNDKRLVKEGQQVNAGEKIAEMGKNAKGRIGLHFQIRKNGKPVNPERYLP